MIELHLLSQISNLVSKMMQLNPHLFKYPFGLIGRNPPPPPLSFRLSKYVMVKKFLWNIKKKAHSDFLESLSYFSIFVLKGCY